MRIIYNGIDLQVLEMMEAVCQPIYDDSQTDLLYCMYKFSATAMVNGLAAVNQVGGGPAVSLAINKVGVTQWTVQNDNVPPNTPGVTVTDAPVSVNNVAAPFLPNTAQTPLGKSVASADRTTFSVVQVASPSAVTIQMLNSKLNTPRGQLWVFSGNGSDEELIVRSHAQTELCDCRNGPIPIATNITKAFGDGATYFVNFQVMAFVDTTTFMRDADTRLLLSNRFSTTHQINADSLVSIAVQGTAHCNAKLINSTGASPDSLRKNLFLPVPGGFTRQQIEVTGSPDGTSVEYSYVDVQQPVNFVMGRYIHATQIEATHRQSIECGTPDALRAGIDLYDRYTNLRNNLAWRQQMLDDAKEKRKAKSAAKAARKTPWRAPMKLGSP